MKKGFFKATYYFFLKRMLLTGICWLCVGIALWGQTIGKNDRGESIVSYPDGSWRYFDPDNSDDQALMRAYLRKQQNTDTEVVKTALDTVTENETFVLLKAIEVAKRAEQQAYEALDAAVLEQKQLKTQLSRLKKSPYVTKKQKKDLKAAIKNAKDAVMEAKKASNVASKRARSYEKIALMQPAQQVEALAALEAEQPKTTTMVAQSPEKKQKRSKTKKTNRKTAKKQKTKNKFADGKRPTAATRQMPAFGKTADSYRQLRPEDDVMLYPPAPDCVVAYEGVEEFTGKKRKDIAPAPFFSYTNEKLRHLEAFKDKDMIECTGHVSSLTGGLVFLSLEIIIHDESAQRNYGILEKGSLLSVRLVDGRIVQLIHKKTNQGVHDRFGKKVIYTAQYLVSPNQEKVLRDVEIDSVRIVWSTGYEEYTVYETDFLIHQLACLRE